MKKACKRFLESHTFLSWLIPAGQWVMGLKFRLRGRLFTEVLRLRLLGARLSAGKPLLVFCRFGAIGDVICTFPAVMALRQKFPELYPVYVTLAQFASLPELAGVAGRVIGSRVHCALPNLPVGIVARKYAPSYADEAGGGPSHRHLVEEFCAACGVALPADGPRLHIAKKKVSGMKERFYLRDGRKTIVIQTGPSWPVREWPHERWQQLVTRLRGESNPRIFHVGASLHVVTGRRPVDSFEGCENLLDHLSLAELSALLACSDLFVGIDSGILHLAGAVGTPCVGLFGPTNPQFRLPRHVPAIGVFHALPCSFCHHRHPRLHWETGCPHGIECMKDLPVEDVAAACRRLLQETTLTGPVRPPVT